MQMRRACRTITLVILSLIAPACAHDRTIADRAQQCGPALSRESILEAADRYLALYSTRRASELNARIHEVDCNYAVVVSHDTEEAKEPLVVTIDRQGRVRTLPECCELGECPDLCAR